MKCNYETCIVGTKCVLVPYRPEHVPTYHQWMNNDPELLELTGSEPLTLEEEKTMQQTWHKDYDKCTFIILCKADCHLSWEDKIVINIQNNLHAMIGDINLFFSDYEEDEEEDEESTYATTTTKTETQQNKNVTNDENNRDDSSSYHYKQAEINVMIANPNHRLLGYGREALLLMMVYGIFYATSGSSPTSDKNNDENGNTNNSFLLLKRFFCKIHETNTPSLQFFRNKLRFTTCNYTKCFQEYELEMKFNIIDNNNSDNNNNFQSSATNNNNRTNFSNSYNIAFFKELLEKMNITTATTTNNNNNNDNDNKNPDDENNNHQEQSTTPYGSICQILQNRIE